MTKDINAILYDKPYELPQVRKAITLPEEKLKQYIGEYTIKENLNLNIELKAREVDRQANQSTRNCFVARKEDFFFVRQPISTGKILRNEKAGNRRSLYFIRTEWK